MTCVDIFRLCPFSWKTSITNPLAHHARVSASSVKPPSDGWRDLEAHQGVLEAQPYEMSNNEADCGKICGISCNSPVVTRNPQRGMHFQGINPLSLMSTYLGTLSSSMVNTLMFCLICSLLEQYESDTIASEMRTTSDVELFLNFVLHVCIVCCAVIAN